jgi:2-keto-4-pentenoate hydratase/2-oxohepta-3-ene-1,7-dioic acid hydratase in catechol pathway
MVREHAVVQDLAVDDTVVGDRWLVPGDVIDGEITGLGHQRNHCVSPPSL